MPVTIDNVNRIHIAGAGIMGASLGLIFARNGYDVIIYDSFEKGIEKGKNLIDTNIGVPAWRGEKTEEQMQEIILSKISFTQDIKCFANAQFVIEAIFEKMDVKHDFWEKASAIVPEDAILTTNTSGLSITKIAQKVQRPERFAGMHWINPPHLIPLVEVIAGEKTDIALLDKVADLSRRVGKYPITVKRDVPGFVLNRIQFCILREAMHLVESGVASSEDVDNVMKYALGIRYACLGPFQVADFGGLDTFHNIASYLFADLCNDKEPQALLKNLYNEGSFGVKTTKGFYDYSNGLDKQAIQKRDDDFIRITKCLFSKG
jgi:3-hydroxybutyryl-CoA dehydrogenase